jgi:DNA polymerase III gamma/tau subunit
LVAPTVLGAGDSAAAHGVEPSYSFIAEKETPEESSTLAPAPEAKGTPSGFAPKRVTRQALKLKKAAAAAPSKADTPVKTIELTTATEAQAEQKKVEQTVSVAQAEEQKLNKALAAVKAEEKKDDPNFKAPNSAPATPAAAPEPAPAAEAAAENAAEAEVGQEEEAVADAEKKVEAEETAVEGAVKDEEAVKDEVSGMEQKLEGEEAQANADASNEDCCKQPADVTVGPKFIPASETRSTLVIGDHEANAEKYNAVDASPKLLTDPAELKSIDESMAKSGDDIAAIGKKVDEISKAPLVESPDGSITA